MATTSKRNKRSDETPDLITEVRKLTAGGRIKKDQSVWKALMRQGVIASLNIGRPRGEQRLTLEDLGLRPRDSKEAKALAAHIKPGVRRLLPPKYATGYGSIESSARHTLGRTVESAVGQGRFYAFQTPFGPFIPAEGYSIWKEKMDGYEKRYRDLTADLLENYAAVRREVLDEYARIATGTYIRLHKTDPDAVKGISMETFVKNYLETIRRGFPTPEQIREGTYFKVNLAVITLPEDLRKSIVAEQLATAGERKKIRALNEMREAVAQSTLQSADTFSQVIDQQLYDLTYRTVASIREGLKSGNVWPKHLQQLRSLYDQIQTLNFVGHKDLKQWAEKIQESVSEYRSTRRPDGAYDNLLGTVDLVMTESRRRLRDIGGSSRLHRSNIAAANPTVQSEARRGRRQVDFTATSAEAGARRKRRVVA